MDLSGKERICLFVTGGTFDKEYDEIGGRLYFQDSHVPQMLTRARCGLDVKVRTLMMVDSLEMTARDRELIVNECRSAPETRIVITHGTDTMETTAQVLASELTGKTVVLTGALIPYKLGSSDGLFNLGSALAFVQALESGIYVVMNGRCFSAGDVRKNRLTGFFGINAEDAEGAG